MSDSPRWSLRDLPFAARLCCAIFLVSVGVGYFSALVQLHFQHGEPGEMLPPMKRVVATFHGHVGAEPKSRLNRLLTAPESLPFTGSGQMSAAFTTRSDGWKREVKKRTNKKEPTAQELEQAEKELRAERQGEIDTVVAWINADAPEEAYRTNQFHLPAEEKGRPMTKEFALEDGEPGGKLEDILKARCTRCHKKEDPEDANAGNYPLESFADFKKYLKIEKTTRMSIEKLTQTTHVHLLSFSMLYFLTGVLFALTRYPALLRVPIASAPLIAQFLDVSCWWLARLDGDTGVWFAQMIPVTGGIVGLGLALQIFLTVFALFRFWGRLVLVALIVAAGYGFYVVKTEVIDPHIAAERAALEVKK